MLELWWKFFNVQVDRTFLKVHAKDLVKEARIREVMKRRRLPILSEIFFKFRYQNSFNEARYFDYANY